MQMPPDSPDLETAKLKIASRFRNFEAALNEQLNELAVSGFADARLVAIAHTDFEKAFLTLEKAIRIGSPDDYAKQPYPPGSKKFQPPTKSVGPDKHIEWRDVKDDTAE